MPHLRRLPRRGRVAVAMLMSLVIGASLMVAALACTSDDEPPTPDPATLATPLPELSFGVAAESVMAPLNVEFRVDEPLADVRYTWDFGDGNRADGPAVSHTYLDIGRFSARVIADFGSETRSAERAISVQPGPAGWMTLNTDAIELQSGEPFRLSVDAFDELGNPVDASEVQFTADPAAGYIHADTVFIAGFEVGEWQAGITATFERAGSTVTQDVPVTILPGPPASLFVEPTDFETRVGWEVELTARVFDDVGHEIEDVDVEWQVLRPGDAVTDLGEYTPGLTMSEPDQPLLVARYVDAESDTLLTQIVSGHVLPGILDEVRVAPDLAGMQPGSSVQLTATGYDRFGNAVPLDSVEWALNDAEIGSINADGILRVGTTAGESAPDALAVRGISEGVQVQTLLPIEIVPGTAASIEFANAFDSVPAGAASPLAVEVRDNWGNVLEDAAVQFAVLNGGSLAATNFFVAGLVPDLFLDAVTAELVRPGMENLVAKTSLSVRERSSDFLAIEVETLQLTTVYMINLVTAQLIPVSGSFVTDEATESMPAWMPDGERLLLSSSLPGTSQIHIVDPFHDLMHQVTDLPDPALMAQPNPAGDRLAFVMSENDLGGWDVVVADLAIDASGVPEAVIGAEDVSLVSAERTFRNILPQWSPDGRWLMYTEIDNANRPTAFIVNPDDPNGDNGIEVPNASGLAWHPLGTEVLITSLQLVGGNRLASVPYMLNVETGDSRELDAGGHGLAVAAFSPDGSELAFVDEATNELWLMDSDGTGLRQAVGGGFNTTITSWRPHPIAVPTAADDIRAFPDERHNRTAIDAMLRDTTTVAAQVILDDESTIDLELRPAIAETAVANFVYLAANDYYDGLAFHTVDESAAFGGSITDGKGGTAGYYLPSELTPNALHDRPGVISMVATRADTVSTEFVISLTPNPGWDGYVDGALRDCDEFNSDCYVVFGAVAAGLDAMLEWQTRTPLDTDIEPRRIVDVLITLPDGTVLGANE